MTRHRHPRLRERSLPSIAREDLLKEEEEGKGYDHQIKQQQDEGRVKEELAAWKAEGGEASVEGVDCDLVCSDGALLERAF